MPISDSEILEAYKKAGGSKKAAAAALGMVRSTFRRRLLELDPSVKREPNAPAQAGANHIGGSPKDREIVRLADEVRRLRGELRDQHRAGAAEEAIAEVIGGIVAVPVAPPKWLVEPRRSGGHAPEVPVLGLADWHFGEVVSREETDGINEYNAEIARERVRKVILATVELCRKHHSKTYPGIVVALIGDMISGALHPELAKTDEYEQIPATIEVLGILVWVLETLAEEFGQVYVPCVSGNHGRNTPKPEYKRLVYKNFDWLIYQLLAKHFEKDSRIVFDIPASNTVFFRVFNKRFLLAHGDMLGARGGDGIIGAIGPIMRGEIKTRQQQMSAGRDFDILLMGHYHQQLWLPRAIVAGTLKGFDEYAQNVLRAPPGTPSQPLFFVHPRRGLTSRWEIYAEEPTVKADAPWVSFSGEAA